MHKKVAIITADFAVLDRTVPSFPSLLRFVDEQLSREINLGNDRIVRAGLSADAISASKRILAKLGANVYPDYDLKSLDDIIEALSKREKKAEKSGLKFKNQLRELLEIYKERAEYLKSDSDFKPGGKKEATQKNWKKTEAQVDRIQQLTLEIKDRNLVCWEEVGGTGFNKSYAAANVLRYAGADVDVRFLGMTGTGNASRKIKADFDQAGFAMDYTMPVLTNSKTSIIYPYLPGVDTKGKPSHDRLIEKSPAQEQVHSFNQEKFNNAFKGLHEKDMVILSVEAMSVEKLGKENFLKFVNKCLKLKANDKSNSKFKLVYAPPTDPNKSIFNDNDIKNALQELHKKCDLMSCNEHEAILCYADETPKKQYLADKNNPEAAPDDILGNLNSALDNAVGKLQKMKLQDGWNPHQMVVVTNGPRQMRVITTTYNKEEQASNKIKTFDPEEIKQKYIVSTLGAGDGFSGALMGIIAAVKLDMAEKFGMKNEEEQKLPKLVAFASRVASVIIGQVPARIPQRFFPSVIANLVPTKGCLEKVQKVVGLGKFEER